VSLIVAENNDKQPPRMSDKLSTKRTTLPPDEVLARAVQFFSTEKWRATSQSPRTSTFEGKVPIPWGSMVITIIGFAMCIVPGIICYFSMIRRLHRFQNLVVSVTPAEGGCEVSVSHPDHATGLAKRFLGALPGGEVKT
jgi:hypothetical protein